MIKVNLLKGEMAKQGYTQTALAKELGMAPKTLNAKMKKGVFKSNEIDAMIALLNISNPVEIFFC